MGFNVSDQFKLVDPETTGDDDVRIIFNHKTKSIYCINRVQHAAYSQLARLKELGHDTDDEDDE